MPSIMGRNFLVDGVVVPRGPTDFLRASCGYGWGACLSSQRGGLNCCLRRIMTIGPSNGDVVELGDWQQLGMYVGQMKMYLDL